MESREEKPIEGFIIGFITIYILIFADSSSNSLIILPLSLSAWLIFILINRKNSFTVTLLRMLIYSLPLSFVSIFGDTTAESNLTWFNIFFVALTICVFIKSLVRANFILSYLGILSLFNMLLLVIPLINSYEFLDALKQYINISVPLTMVILGINLKLSKNNYQIRKIILDYVFSTSIAAVGVIIQVILHELFNYNVGHLTGFRVRTAYGFLFADFSFLSLFIVSGAAILISYINTTEKKVNKKYLLGIAFLLIASIMTSARTGPVAFLIILVIHAFFKFINGIYIGLLKNILLMFICIFVTISGLLLLNSLRGGFTFSDNGRIPGYLVALEIFSENVPFGMGLGRMNYATVAKSTIPHNFIIQYLAQIGIIATLMICTQIIAILLHSFKNNKVGFIALSVVFIGAMFIPNIFNSRFLGVLFALAMMWNNSDCEGKRYLL